MAESREHGSIKKDSTLFNNAGFDWKTCDQFPSECSRIAWPKKGESIVVYSAKRIFYNGKTNKVFLEIGYNSDKGYKIGYIDRDFVDTDYDISSCASHNFSSLVAATEDVANIVVKSEEFDEKIDALNNRRVFSPKCLNYVDSHGKIGPWGKKVLDAFELADKDYKDGKSCFYDDLDVSYVCPKFKSFNENKKSIFWLYVYASMSQVESSCRVEAQAQGTNGIADGLLQLEYSKSLRRNSGRDPILCSTRQGVDTQSLDFQFNCSASIFRDIYCDRGRPIHYAEGYWLKLRGKNKLIHKLIKRFPGCF
ncbi:MAG: hypothetical protein KDD50_10730 [Bdellovibrionales bacterium]|nr:hypothetical protein [Bdellovibrionales bacterium]